MYTINIHIYFTIYILKFIYNIYITWNIPKKIGSRGKFLPTARNSVGPQKIYLISHKSERVYILVKHKNGSTLNSQRLNSQEVVLSERDAISLRNKPSYIRTQHNIVIKNSCSPVHQSILPIANLRSPSTRKTNTSLLSESQERFSHCQKAEKSATSSFSSERSQQIG